MLRVFVPLPAIFSGNKKELRLKHINSRKNRLLYINIYNDPEKCCF